MVDTDYKRKTKVTTQDGDEIAIEYEIAMMLGAIRNATELEDSHDDDDEPIPFTEVSTPIMEKVLEYCRHHLHNPAAEIQVPLKSSNLADSCSEWDVKFIELDQKTLCSLLKAANYLDVKPLLELAAAKVASKIKGKTPEEIRKEFQIVNDFTPEEEAQVREENKWCEEA